MEKSQRQRTGFTQGNLTWLRIQETLTHKMQVANNGGASEERDAGGPAHNRAGEFKEERN